MSPDVLQIAERGRALEIAWRDDQRALIPAGRLWARCPSAVGIRRRLDGVLVNPPVGLVITKLALVGGYGVNIGFSDGHARGIYSWALLRELAVLPRCDDFIIAINADSIDLVKSRPSHETGA